MQINIFKGVQLVALSALFVVFSNDATAVTERQAYVVVKNKTGKDIASVELGHKYSDVHEDQHDWTNLKNGASTSPQRVTYNTGFGTTGRDWWLVSWAYSGSDYVYHSDPNNFREIFDSIETITAEDGDTVVRLAALGVGLFGAGCTIITGGACIGPAAAAMTAVSAFTAGELIDKTMSHGGTAGYKQHILRSEDEGKIVTITLYPNYEISISSPSGVSWTVYDRKLPEVENRQYTYNRIAQKIEELQGPKPLDGNYENHAYDNGGKNDWHYVEIVKASNGDYVWKNRAGVSWKLKKTSSANTYAVGTDCPYYASGYRQAKVEVENGQVVGIYGPYNEYYTKH